MKKKCGICCQNYVIMHTCKGGECPDCRTHFKDLDSHRCPVRKLNTIGVAELVGAFHCGVCCKCFFSKSSLRVFKNVQLCAGCYDIPQIKEEQTYLRSILHSYLVLRKKTHCAFCNVPLLTSTGTVLNYFHLDHCSVFEKEGSVGFMVFEGFPIHEILRESEKCRTLCIPCHSAITCVESSSGIWRVKHQPLSNVERHNLTMKIDHETEKILIQTWKSEEMMRMDYGN